MICVAVVVGAVGRDATVTVRAIAANGGGRNGRNGPRRLLGRNGQRESHGRLRVRYGGVGGRLFTGRRTSRTARYLPQLRTALEHARFRRRRNLFDFLQILGDARRILLQQSAGLDVGRARRRALRRILHLRHVQTGFRHHRRIVAVLFVQAELAAQQPRRAGLIVQFVDAVDVLAVHALRQIAFARRQTAIVVVR